MLSPLQKALKINQGSKSEAKPPIQNMPDNASNEV
jgi:hypothetical protein